MLKMKLHQNPARSFGWELFIVDEQRDESWVLKFEKYKIETRYQHIEPTFFSDGTTYGKHPESLDTVANQEFLQKFGQALQEAGFMPDNATQAELKATKFHLEDMRKLTHCFAEER